MLHLPHNSVIKYRFAYAWTKVKTDTLESQPCKSKFGFTYFK